MRNSVLTIACTLLALAVVLGAFGAHTLEASLTADQLAAWNTGVKYHFIHALGLLVLGLVYRFRPSRWLRMSLILLSIGILFFSGSIYLLTTQGWRWLGPVTPIGGVCFILGWITAIFGLKESLKDA